MVLYVILAPKHALPGILELKRVVEGHIPPSNISQFKDVYELINFMHFQIDFILHLTAMLQVAPIVRSKIAVNRDMLMF